MAILNFVGAIFFSIFMTIIVIKIKTKFLYFKYIIIDREPAKKIMTSLSFELIFL